METKTQHSKIQFPYQVHLIGCGGVGSWVLPALARLGPQELHLWDGDVLEQKNLDRQLFSEDDIGANKAVAIDRMVKLPDSSMSCVHPEYFHEGSEVAEGSLILCCADNHAARRAALMKADDTGSTTIIAGNEYTDADAYIYVPFMRGTPNDPRVFAPEILTDNTGDPRRPDGCTGLAQQQNPQLVLANMAAADHMLRLMWWWFAEVPRLSNDTRAFWPVMHKTSASRSFTVLLKDRLEERKAVA